MARKEPKLNMDIIKATKVKAICHHAVDVDQDWDTHSVKLRPTKEFMDAFNRTTMSILLRAMDSACRHGRTTVRPEDIPTLSEMGLDEPETLGVQVGDAAEAV